MVMLLNGEVQMEGQTDPKIFVHSQFIQKKEEKGLLVEFVPLVETEVEEINKNGVPININGKKLSAVVLQ